MTKPRHITCDQCQELLEEFALEELAEAEALQVRDHLVSGCYICNLQLAQVIADWSLSPALLPAELPPLRIERELMQSIAGMTPRPQMSSATPLPDPELVAIARPANRQLITAALAIAASLLAFAAWISWQNGGRNLAGEAAYQAELQRRMEQADHSQHFSSIPHLNFAYVNNPAPPRPVYGYVIDDRIASQLHLYAFNLPPLAEGRAYEVWFVTKDSEFLDAGKLEIDADGAANKIVELPSGTSPITGIAISDEPSGNSPPKPTGLNFVKADLPR